MVQSPIAPHPVLQENMGMDLWFNPTIDDGNDDTTGLEAKYATYYTATGTTVCSTTSTGRSPLKRKATDGPLGIANVFTEASQWS